jgi:hypothetical protein
MRISVPVGLICVTLLPTALVWAQCQAGDATGQFEGSATSAEAGKTGQNGRDAALDWVLGSKG